VRHWPVESAIKFNFNLELKTSLMSLIGAFPIDRKLQQLFHIRHVINICTFMVLV